MLKIYKVFFIISLILMAASLVLFFIYGLNLGTDFTGGSLLETEFLKNRPERGVISERLNNLNLGQISISEAGERGLILKMPEISEESHQEILAELRKSGELEEKRFDSIGSVLGSELKRKSITAIVIALILISVYLAIVFSRVGGIVAPWVLALGAIIALIHDLLLPIGVFSWLGKFKGAVIDASMIAAALAILGYSINDTVVVYDRIRENILSTSGGSAIGGRNFNDIVRKSVQQTLVRSINTTLTTLFAVLAIYIFGGASLKNFSLALIIGIASGAYSSIFVASPILMIFHKK